jgi:serine/threonine protein kinase
MTNLIDFHIKLSENIYNQDIEELFYVYNIRKFNEKINHKNLKIINKGQNGAVYFFELNNKRYLLKSQKIFFDTPLILVNNTTCLLTQTAVNDLVISWILYKSCPMFTQKYYGYYIDDDQIYFIKKYIEQDMIKYIMNHLDELNFYIIHILCTIQMIFEDRLKGYHFDLKLDNMLLQKTDQQYIQYKNFRLKCNGYIPIIYDCGSSLIYYKNRIIGRHILYKNDKSNYCNIYKTFDPRINIKDFFIRLRNFCKKKNIKNELIDEYFRNNNLTIDKYFKLDKVSKYIKNIII